MVTKLLLVNFLTKIRFLIILGACRTFVRDKEGLGEGKQV